MVLYYLYLMIKIHLGVKHKSLLENLGPTNRSCQWRGQIWAIVGVLTMLYMFHAML